MSNHNLKILAIDDIQDNLTTLKAVVGDAFPNALFLSALSGSAGIALALLEDPDVILLDIVMPEMDGFEVCRRLKATEEIHHIPVVFLTALQTGRESRINALEAGGEGFLAKPLDETELIAQIRAMSKIKAAAVSQRQENDRLSELVTERTRKLHIELAARQLTENKLMQNLAKLNELNRNLEAAQNKLIHSENPTSKTEISKLIELTQSNFVSLAERLDDLLTIDADYSKVETHIGIQHPQEFERAHQSKNNTNYKFIIQDMHKLLEESKDRMARIQENIQAL